MAAGGSRQVMDSGDTAEFVLNKRAVYRGEELLLHRKHKGQCDETLVKWSRLPCTEKPEEQDKVLEKGKETEPTSSIKEFLIWMREEEIAACCPQLSTGPSTRLTRKLDGQACLGEKGQQSSEAAEQVDDSLEEMAQDVRMLVERAQRITHRISSNSSAPGTERRLANTINILSAYAKLGSLADSFRQCGALDLLLNLLSFQLPEVRQSAGEMLRSLSAYDSASRAYVLLQLTQREGEGKEGGATSLENREMLLDLFAETASQGEDSLSCSNLGLAKVPGRRIYSLLKKYLRVTSLANPFGWRERTPSSSSPSPPPLPKISNHRSHPSMSEDFDRFECLFHLLSELFTVFEWTESYLREERDKSGTDQACSRLRSFSIFTGTTPTSVSLSLAKQRKRVYKTRDDFVTDREYGEYVKGLIQPGSRVRARVKYESVSEGDLGKYLGTNDGTPPAQCAWEGLNGGSYWVHWYQLELLGDEENDTTALNQAPTSAVSHTARRPYALTNLVSASEAGVVSRYQWWEVLCLVKTHPETHLQEVLTVLAQQKLKRFEDLLPLTPTYSKVAELMVKLETLSPHFRKEPLSVREEEAFRTVYKRLSPVFKEEGLPPLAPDPHVSEKLKKRPPYPDPYDMDDLSLPLQARHSASHSLMMLVSGIAPNHFHTDSPLSSLESAIASWAHSEFTLTLVMSHKSIIEKLLAKHPRSCRVAVYSLKVIMAAVNKITRDIDRIDCCVSCSLFSLILQLMQQEKTSHTLQALGLKCFYALMGGASIDGSIPLSPSKIRPEPLSNDARLTVLTVVVSLSSASSHAGLKTIAEAIECVTNCYNLSMSSASREDISTAVQDGLSILVAIMNMNDSPILKQMESWEIPKLLTSISKYLPHCPTRSVLCQQIAAGLQGSSSQLEDKLTSSKLKGAGKEEKEEEKKNMPDQIIGAIRALQTGNFWSRTPLPLLLKLTGLQPPVEDDALIRPPPLFTKTFLLHQGVHHLARNIEQYSSSSSILESAVRLLGCLVTAGEEEAEEVILQGGLRVIMSAITLSTSQQKSQLNKLASEVLLLLAKHPDTLVVMAAENILPVLLAMREKFVYEAKHYAVIEELTGKLKGEKLPAKVSQGKKIMAIIFAGVLQLLMAEIEDTRRSQQLPCIPLLSSFISFISFGSRGDGSLGKKEVCWERLEVSSNTYRKSRLTDSNTDTYWESSGRSGAHWVRLVMKKDIVIKRLAVDVNPSDSSYMPHRVVVQGGPTPENVIDLNTVTVPSTFRGSFEILSNMTRHYPVIVIRIKRCQQGGIDVRLRGLSCDGGQSSLWPIFGDLLMSRTKLFYCIQAHTWTADTGLGPLELFDRLRRVIIYEQSFADSYLLPASARQALGQACRTALFNPVITALSSKDRRGMCMSDLLSSYLSHIHPPAGVSALLPTSDFCSNDIMMMSSIRRMCRLLVDCDGNIATPTEGEAEPMLVLASGSGIVTMATCWQEVVAKEVKQCLARCDLSIQPRLLVKPHPLVRELVWLYNRLQHATMELFGGHSWFVVAMKEGFSRVLQSMDEVSGVRLCEVLCECVDTLVCTAVDSRDSGQLLFAQRKENEVLLEQVSELLQLINKLDLIHVFEYFYRCSLSRRLLFHSSVAVSQEKQLVQSLAHCFPQGHPQRMLADIEESQNLMDRFCQLNLLESLDQLLDKHGIRSKDVPAGALELNRKIMFYRQRLMEVSVLTTWCWPLHHSPLPPLSSLPPLLTGFIDDYTNFFRSTHHGSHPHEHTRQLQWTLHGTAMLTCDTNIHLLVTTTQMIILIQFNTSEKLTYSQLIDSTLLPADELSESLQLLISEPHPILTVANKHSLPSSSTAPISVLQPNTVFQVNNVFISQLLVSGDRPVLCCHGNGNRSIGMSGGYSDHLFKQRRTVIDAAITRIMKREKTLSVDSVAAEVIKGCSAGQLPGGISFGRFDCSFKDVCASVERLRASGYVIRNPDHPHILVYVPDTGGEESIAEQGHPSSEVSTTSSATLPPSLPLLSSLPPTPLSSTTAVASPSLSSPLGLPRKRSGSSTSPFTNPKRKQLPVAQSHTQTFTTIHEEREEKECPLFVTSSSSAPSLSLPQVQEKAALLTARVAAVMDIAEDQAECLLVLCKWNQDILLQRFFTDREALLADGGLAPASPAPLSFSQDLQLQCPVCLQDQREVDMLCLWCGHKCCKPCWTSHLQTQVISFTRALHCTCPATDCPARPIRSFFYTLFEPNSQVMEHFNKAVVRSYVDSTHQLTWCRNPLGCDQVLCQGENMDCEPCSKCGWSSCFRCTYVESHQPASCSDIHKWIEGGGFHEGMDEDARSKHLANIISKRCPSCSTQIEKNEGCLNVKCKCGYDFCWRCMKPWRPAHTDYFNCTAKVSKAAKDAKKLVDYNQRCAGHHKSKLFAQKLCVLVKGISDPTPTRTLSFLIDACELLVTGHKMLCYASVAEFCTPSESHEYLSILTSDLETNVAALQSFLENTLLGSSSPAHAVRMLPERRLQDGYHLLNSIRMTREKIIVGSCQQYKLGDSPSLSSASTGSGSSVAQESGKKLHNGVSLSIAEEEREEEEEDEDEEDDWDDDDGSLYSSEHYDSYYDHYDHEFDSDDDYGLGNPFF